MAGHGGATAAGGQNQSKTISLALVRFAAHDVSGQRFDWQRGDFFVVPPWAWHEHTNNSREEAVLFSVQDTPVMRAFGLYREQPFDQNQGHQNVTSRFGDL